MSRYLTMLALVWITGMTLLQAIGEEPKFTVRTHTYKKVGDCEIQADIHRADDDVVRPVVVWIHGGALITGSRLGIPADLVKLCQAEGYALVSIDYRLAPETQLPAIIEDIKDAFAWIRREGPALHLDPSKLVVTGGSAGGYLTMMTGICVEPKPTALVAYWGYGDVDGDWFSKPSEYYRTAMPMIPRQDAMQGVGTTPVTGSTPETSKGRGRFYHYLRQGGRWTNVVTGFDPTTERAKLDPYCPVRNITADYPPILMVHGTVDTDVPYSRSANMDKELSAQGVKHVLITVPGAGHGLSGGDKQQVADALAEARAFIKEHLK
jgi:acetyl esterase/lipase